MGTETDGLLTSLTDQRNHVLGIVDVLSDADLRRPVLPSGWSCIGMVNHLALTVERFWFRRIVAGEKFPQSVYEEEPAAYWHVDADTTTDFVLASYRREIGLANAIITATDLDASPAMWPEEMWPTWRLDDLRTILLHVITETACHAGHLDAARELIDGRTWMSG